MKVKKILLEIGKICGMAGAIGGVVYLNHKEVVKQTNIRNRYQMYYQMTNQWLTNKNKNITIEQYFAENNIKNIAIYGMGTLCELFYEELKNSKDVHVKYFIDKDAKELCYGLDNIPVESIDSMSEDELDAVIITPIYDYEEINRSFEEQNIGTQRISLEDIIFNA